MLSTLQGVTGTADQTQPTFARPSSLAPSPPVQPPREQMPQLGHDQQDLQQTWHDQHIQLQQLATSGRLQQPSSSPSRVRKAMQSPSRIPVAPVAAGSPRFQTAGPTAVRCRTPPAVQPHAVATVRTASVAIRPALGRATASQQSPGLPILGHTSLRASLSLAVAKRHSSECSSLRSSTDSLSSSAQQRTTHMCNSNNNSPIPGSDAERPSTPTILAGSHLGSRSNSPRQKQSPRRSTRGSPTPGEARCSNSPNRIHLHPSVAALLGPAGTCTPAMQQHKDRRRAELYALNAVLAK